MDARKIGILHIPHCSCSIPTDERVRLAISGTELEAELRRMTDAFTAELFSRRSMKLKELFFPPVDSYATWSASQMMRTNQWPPAAWARWRLQIVLTAG